MFEVLKNFFSFIKEWSNLFLILVGSLAIVIYVLQERRKSIDAASLIILQVDEFQNQLREISTYIVEGQLNSTAFYESLPLVETDYWTKYKHYFVRKMDDTSYNSLNKLYEYVSEIQEQQMLTKNFQINSFYITQNVLANIETQLIFSGLNLYTPNITQNDNFDSDQFLEFYRNQRNNLEHIINQEALTQYVPIQIRISLEKILTKYSMLEISGTDGYRMLKKLSKKRF